jgi:hypothetical protein
MELNRLLTWLIRWDISAVSLSSGMKTVRKYLEIDAEEHKTIFVDTDVLCIIMIMAIYFFLAT